MERNSGNLTKVTVEILIATAGGEPVRVSGGRGGVAHRDQREIDRILDSPAMAELNASQRSWRMSLHVCQL